MRSLPLWPLNTLPALLLMAGTAAAGTGAAPTAATATATNTSLSAGTYPWAQGLPEQIHQAASLAVAAATELHDGQPPRLEVALGAPDPRLKLAPCQRVQPSWPVGQRWLATARIGVRCVEGPTRWQLYLPVSIRAWKPGLVAASALPAGTVLKSEHLQVAEVDLLARRDPAILQPAQALGRPLAQPLAAGQALRQADVRLRQWVRPGDTVRLVALGADFQISAEAQALAPALEGQTVRVRTESGRILQGVASGERQVSVAL